MKQEIEVVKKSINDDKNSLSEREEEKKMEKEMLAVSYGVRE